MIDENLFSTIYSYCENHSNIDSDILNELYRETHLKTLAPRMASGPIQGRFLSLLSKLLAPKEILEIGTFTGYATICLSEGLAINGQITTIEINPEYDNISDKYFKKAGIRNQVNSIIGDAKKLISRLDKEYDLVFIDAKKTDYSTYFNQIINKVVLGGIILVDNVLWDGKVFKNDNDQTTKALKSFNIELYNDDRVTTLLLPLRDGLSILRRV